MRLEELWLWTRAYSVSIGLNQKNVMAFLIIIVLSNIVFFAGLSAMVRGAANSSNFTVMDYDETEIAKILQDYFAQLK